MSYYWLTSYKNNILGSMVYHSGFLTKLHSPPSRGLFYHLCFRFLNLDVIYKFIIIKCSTSFCFAAQCVNVIYSRYIAKTFILNSSLSTSEFRWNISGWYYTFIHIAVSFYKNICFGILSYFNIFKAWLLFNLFWTLKKG